MMRIFNHQIEYEDAWVYQGVLDEYKGMEIRTAIVEYDDAFQNRCQFKLSLPADLWTHIKVGGTMSTGGLIQQGLISRVNKPRHDVTTPNGMMQCYHLPLHAPIQQGQSAVVFDHMRHDPCHYGSFLPAVTTLPIAPEMLNVHSVNIIIQNNDAVVGVVHIDPFTQQANFDECRIKVGKHLWTINDLR